MITAVSTTDILVPIVPHWNANQHVGEEVAEPPQKDEDRHEHDGESKRSSGEDLVEKA